MPSINLSPTYIVNLDTGEEQESALMPADVEQSETPWIAAENNLYGDIVDDEISGKWLLEFPRDEINEKWLAVKEGVKQGYFWVNKVSPKNAHATHLICIYAPNSEDIATTIDLYNHLVKCGLTDPSVENLRFKTTMQTLKLEPGYFKYTSNELPTLMLEYLQNQIDSLDLSHAKFRHSLQKLKDDLSVDIAKQQDKQLPYASILTSTPISIAIETSHMLSTLQKTRRVTNDDKLEAINTFKTRCSKTSRFKCFMKAIAVVAAAAIGFVVGAAIGAGIGILAGAWAGPGAAVTATAGLFKGAMSGAACGLLVGSAVTGISSAAVTGCLLFKPNNIEKIAKEAKKVMATKSL